MDALNFYRSTINPNSNAVKLLAPELANSAQPLAPEVTDLLAFFSLMRPLGEARAKSE